MMGCTPSSGKKDMTPLAPLASRDHFAMDYVIGEGGFGTVYSAIYSNNKKRYAVKEINKYELLTHRTGFNMLYSELNALKTVDHAFVAGMDFAFHDSINAYLVLSLKTGADLRHYLKKKLIFEECNVAFYIACISSALAHCHSRRVLHRDVKPENIILDDQGFPHLTDFGVAYVQPEADGNEFDSSSALCCTLASGTKQYLAPEVFTKGHVHGPESDFWALGVVAYELLHGVRPFHKHVPNTMISYLQKSREKYSTTSDAKKKERQRKAVALSQPSKTPERKSAKKAFEEGSPKSTTEGYNSGATTQSPGSSRMSTPFGSPSQTPMSTQPADATAADDTASPVARQRPLIFPKIADAAHDDSWDKSCGEVEPVKRSTRGESTTHEAASASSSFSSEGRTVAEVTSDEDIYGTFWVYPSEPSSAEGLKVQIPTSNAWLGAISKECQEVLRGLFEVRPTHRWGGRNIHKIRESPLLSAKNLSDWKNLQLKDPEVTPHFIPGNAIVHERVRFDRDDRKRHEVAEERVITPEQERQFSDFGFTNPDLVPALMDSSHQTNSLKTATLSSSATTMDGQDVNYAALDIRRANEGAGEGSNNSTLLPEMTSAQQMEAPAPDVAAAGTSGFYGGGKMNPAKLLAAAAAGRARPSTTVTKKHGEGDRKQRGPFSQHPVSSWISGTRREELSTAKQSTRKQTSRQHHNHKSVDKFGKSHLNFNNAY